FAGIRPFQRPDGVVCGLDCLIQGRLVAWLGLQPGNEGFEVALAPAVAVTSVLAGPLDEGRQPGGSPPQLGMKLSQSPDVASAIGLVLEPDPHQGAVKR